jgi:hypothetical protein
MTTVLFAVLLFSGLGSYTSHRISLRTALLLLVVSLLIFPALLPAIFNQTLGLDLAFRIGFSITILAPIAFLMGIPFPGGIRWMIEKNKDPQIIPWVWGVNGAASVVAAVLAALLALSFGLTWVLRLGALCYAGSWFVVMVTARPASFSPPRR